MLNTLLLVIAIWMFAFILIMIINTPDKKRYMLVEPKNVRYFETWDEVAFYVKNAQQVDNFYEFQVFVKDKNIYLYLCDSIL